MKTEITLTFNRADFEEIYFGEGHDNVFFGPATRRKTIALIIASVGFPFALLYGYSSGSNWITIPVTFLFVAVCYDFWRGTRQVVTWKKSVHAFLDKNERFRTNVFSYDTNGFCITQDDETTCVSWDDVLRATVTPQYISIKTPVTDLLFPPSAMPREAYTKLSDFITAEMG